MQEVQVPFHGHLYNRKFKYLIMEAQICRNFRYLSLDIYCSLQEVQVPNHGGPDMKEVQVPNHEQEDQVQGRLDCLLKLSLQITHFFQ